MTNAGTLQVTTPSEREIVMTRVFDAPRDLVFDAHTKPALLTRWLGVRGGWTFPVCEVDLNTAPQLKERIKAEPAIHADETGAPINGTNGYTWLFGSKRIVLYDTGPSRGGKDPARA